MSIASLANTTVVVERATDTTDAAGGLSRTWATHLTLRVWLHESSGSESYRYGRDSASTTHTLRTTGDKDITPGDRIKWVDGTRTRYLDIEAVRRLRTPKGLHHIAMQCREDK